LWLRNSDPEPADENIQDGGFGSPIEEPSAIAELAGWQFRRPEGFAEVGLNVSGFVKKLTQSMKSLWRNWP
jgi:hypothetical protein